MTRLASPGRAEGARGGRLWVIRRRRGNSRASPVRRRPAGPSRGRGPRTRRAESRSLRLAPSRRNRRSGCGVPGTPSCGGSRSARRRPRRCSDSAGSSWRHPARSRDRTRSPRRGTAGTAPAGGSRFDVDQISRVSADGDEVRRLDVDSAEGRADHRVAEAMAAREAVELSLSRLPRGRPVHAVGFIAHVQVPAVRVGGTLL